MGETADITNIELLLAGMLGMFLLALGVVFFFLAYQRRIIKQQKEHQAKEAEYQQQLMRANLLSQEKERNRIGKDLHDGVGAMLSTSKLYFRHLEQDGNPEKFQELKEKAMDLLEETMTSVRRVSHDLKPVVLERLGLVEAIANMADQLSESGAIKVCFKNSWRGQMDKEYELNWFRIVQELLNNTIKHSGATEVYMELFGDQEQVQFSYHDNGVGLTNKSTAKAGLGMQNIVSRLSLMQGELRYGENQENGISLTMKAATGPTNNDREE
ncbi:MAG: sensor histidine kinase [Roseivirga sp.]|nr:sensor histidine kinase [Roseivirga sp.]